MGRAAGAWLPTDDGEFCRVGERVAGFCDTPLEGLRSGLSAQDKVVTWQITIAIVAQSTQEAFIAESSACDWLWA